VSNTKDLKNYLLKKENAFLLDDSNNGKTIMLSGAWGAGKTYFWQNEIEKELAPKLKDGKKACVYVSLYGKDNIEALKNEILFKAYASIEDESNVKKKAISAFGVGSKIFSFSAFGLKADTKEISKKLEEYDEEKKIEKAESFIEDGGVICLDDFERKSKKIDLNDLFGFISQLAVEMNCKIVIILNSDVFEGKEAEVFRRVKEKTVNKYFYFEPTIEELFGSIVSNERYQTLYWYKENILKAIIETEELNARIYIQVLDNCLEWKREKGLDVKVIRVLVMSTINFILNHLTFESKMIQVDKNSHNIFKSFNDVHYTHTPNIVEGVNYIINSINEIDYQEIEEYINDEIDYCTQNVIERIIYNVETKDNEKFKKEKIKYIQDNDNVVKSLHFFNFFKMSSAEYKLDIELFNKINSFVKTGILIK